MTDVISSIRDVAISLEFRGYSFRWYIFGSYMIAKELAMDVDLLVIYKTIDSAKVVRSSLREISLHVPLDLLLMTEDEEEESHFIAKQSANKIYPAH